MSYEAHKGLQLDVSSISLPDGGDRQVTLSGPGGGVLILSGGAKGAMNEGRRWGQAIDRAIESLNGVTHFRLAFLRNLPPVVPRAFMKLNARKEPPTLFDWDGTAETRLGFVDPNRVHVFVVDRRGVLRLRLVGDYSEEALDVVMAEVREWISSPEEGEPA